MGAGLKARSAFAKGVLRTVRGSLRRFLAIVTITALGVTMLVGLRAACVDLRNSADSFFDEQGLFDVRVQSTLGLTDEDVAALAKLDGVEAVEGGWVETAYTTVGSASEKVDVKALSDSGLNAPVVLEGHLPERDDQIAVTKRFLEDSGLYVGDTVTFRGQDDGEEDSTEVFERKEYTIIAVVLDPMEINAGEGTMSFRSSGGSQYSFFVLDDSVIDQSAYTVAYLTVEGADAPLCYSPEYEDVVDEVFQSVEDARSERERARGEGLRADATAEVDEAVRTLRQGGIVLYPTDTVWGLGCDATNAGAVERIYRLKRSENKKSMLVLCASADMVVRYVNRAPGIAFEVMEMATSPLTAILPGAAGVAPNLIPDEGTLGVRIPDHEFCRRMLRAFGKPVVSTSANISGEPTAVGLQDVAREIVDGADFVVNPRFEGKPTRKASSIIAFGEGGEVKIIRE